MSLFKNSSSSGKKLDFIIAGTQKAGTSAIHYYLKQHPEIALGIKKELQYFDNEEIFKKGQPDYSLLHKQILQVQGSKISGECTPTYMYWIPAMRRIWEYNPEIKIIIILRNPVVRAYSQWNMFKTKGIMGVDFGDYILREQELARRDLPLQSRVCSCIDRGFYSEQLRRIFMFFKKENVLILKYEDFKVNQLEGITAILKFLGVNPALLKFTQEQVNSSEYTSQMTVKEQEVLLELYKNEIPEVERILGWNCEDWKLIQK